LVSTGTFDIAGRVAVRAPGLGKPISIARRRGECSLPVSLAACEEDEVNASVVVVNLDVVDRMDLVSSTGGLQNNPSVFILGTSMDVPRSS
jgi:hypothetical protein